MGAESLCQPGRNIHEADISAHFLAAKPLQAGKLAAIVGVLAFGLLGFFRIIPGEQLSAMLAAPFVSLCLALVVVAETLVAGYRAVRADDSPTTRLRARPGYAVVRAVEAPVAILATAGVVGTIMAVPDGPMAGPGAIGLLFIVVGFGLLILGASLVRTLAEYYYYRRGRPAEAAT